MGISSGFVAPNFAKLKPLFEENFAKGDDVGATMAVYVDGELKVNLAGGYSDREAGKLYTTDTLQIVFSCTKAMVSHRCSIS
jgi:CubicO group peptidase (beta-lactamase class C family)